MSHRKVLRNLEILRIRQRGASLTQLAGMYGLTVEGIRGIVKNEGAKDGFGPYAYLLSGTATNALRRFCREKRQQPPQTVRELRRLLRKGWQREISAMKGVGSKTVEELEWIRAHDVRLERRDTSERNRRIHELREEGLSFREIGDMFGITQNRARDVHRRVGDMKRLDEERRLSSGPLADLSNSAFRVVCTAVNRARLDLENPGWREENRFWPEELRRPISFEDFRSWMGNNPDRYVELVMQPRGGKVTADEIMEFARGHGIIRNEGPDR